MSIITVNITTLISVRIYYSKFFLISMQATFSGYMCLSYYLFVFFMLNSKITKLRRSTIERLCLLREIEVSSFFSKSEATFFKVYRYHFGQGDQQERTMLKLPI